MRVIIAGGRNYSFTLEDIHWLDSIRGRISEVVSGNAPGADQEGEQWAALHDIPIKLFPANWRKHGRAAGPIRNEEMAQYADALIPFQGGRGTQDMIRKAEFYGLEIITPETRTA